jgi:hypothetical protein
MARYVPFRFVVSAVETIRRTDWMGSWRQFAEHMTISMSEAR